MLRNQRRAMLPTQGSLTPFRSPSCTWTCCTVGPCPTLRRPTWRWRLQKCQERVQSASRRAGASDASAPAPACCVSNTFSCACMPCVRCYTDVSAPLTRAISATSCALGRPLRRGSIISPDSQLRLEPLRIPHPHPCLLRRHTLGSQRHGNTPSWRAIFFDVPCRLDPPRAIFCRLSNTSDCGLICGSIVLPSIRAHPFTSSLTSNTAREEGRQVRRQVASLPDHQIDRRSTRALLTPISAATFRVQSCARTRSCLAAGRAGFSWAMSVG